MSARRSQAERREATQAKLLASARRMFGENGYADTSLEDIAADCGVTVRPIYHYFDSKLGLFTAVTEEIEQEIVRNMEGREDVGPSDIWTGFMKNCEDPHFRQIILIDGPTLLGRRRQADGQIAKAARQRTAGIFGAESDSLKVHMLMGALSHAALFIADQGADAEDYERIRELIEFFSRQEKKRPRTKSPQ